MAANPLPCAQAKLDAVFLAHKETVCNFGQYENISRTMGVSGKGLAALHPFLVDVLKVAPFANVHLTQIKDAVLTLIKAKSCNQTALSDKAWAGQRTERVITLLAHLRRLMTPFRFNQCTAKCSATDIKILQNIVNLIDVETCGSLFGGENSSSGSCMKRQLESHPSNASNLTMDSDGFPAMLSSPKKPKNETHAKPLHGTGGMEMPEEMSADMEDLLEQLCIKKPAVKVTTFKKPAGSSSSTSLDRPKKIETAKGTLKITYATAQSYIHFQDLHGASTFLTARLAKTSKHHADEVYTLAKKLATLKHETGPKMKEAALKLKGW
jgi:hypothetical protein